MKNVVSALFLVPLLTMPVTQIPSSVGSIAVPKKLSTGPCDFDVVLSARRTLARSSEPIECHSLVPNVVVNSPFQS